MDGENAIYFHPATCSFPYPILPWFINTVELCIPLGFLLYRFAIITLPPHSPIHPFLTNSESKSEEIKERPETTMPKKLGETSHNFKTVKQRK